jgi:outer membrane immunogenic protein
MNKVLLAICAPIAAVLAIGSSAAVAQESPFTGFYIGVHGGAAFADTSGVFDNGGNPGPFDLSRLNLDGAIVGGQIGYQYQAGMFVVGVEGDASTIAGSDDLAGPSLGSYTVQAETDRLLSLRGRFGIATGNFMLFGTAGYGEIKNTFKTVSATVASSNSSVDFENSGAVYGGGIEYAFGSGLFRIEYLHYDVGSTKAFAADELHDSDIGDHFSVDDVDVVRAALSYKIN